MRSLSLLLLPYLFAAEAYAQTQSADLGGYLEYLFSTTFDSPTGNNTDHLIHARFNGKWYPSTSLTGIMEIRVRGYAGETVEKTPEFAEQLKNRLGYGDLDATLWSGHSSIGYAEVDRLSMNWAPKNWLFTVGRQRIAWGTNLVWNVIDVFNPLSILDFDYPERPAADAVQAQYFTSAVTKVAVAYKPRTTYSESITGILWTLNRWDYDFHLVGGEKFGLAYVGGGWAGDIAGGGFRGEMLISRRPDILTGEATGKLMESTALSGDYTFPSSFYVHTEVLYNSLGVNKGGAVYLPISQRLGLLSPSRWSVYQELAYDISSLVRGSLFGIYNPGDRSVALVPSVSWSAATNLDVMVLGLIFSGASGTQYGALGKGIYIQTKWSF